MKLAINSLILISVLSVLGQPINGRVVRVADGDTLTVLDTSNNAQNKIRLEKIDAPEKSQAFGEVSRKHLAELVAGKTVRVEWVKKDKYDRILGEVFVGEVNVNLKMVQDGLAWHFKKFDNTPTYAQAENEARAKKVGLWKDANPIPPWDFRKKTKSHL